MSPRYNKADHPIAFHKGDMFAASKRKVADIGPPADNEEVFEVRLRPIVEPSSRGSICDNIADRPRRMSPSQMIPSRTRAKMIRSMISQRIN